MHSPNSTLSLSLVLMALACPLVAPAQQVERDVPVLSERDSPAASTASAIAKARNRRWNFAALPSRSARKARRRSNSRTVARASTSKSRICRSVDPRTVFDVCAVGRDGGWERQQPRLDRSEQWRRRARGNDAAVALCADRKCGAAFRGDGPEPRDRAAEPRQAGARREIQHPRAQGTHRLFVAVAAAAGPGRQEDCRS